MNTATSNQVPCRVPGCGHEPFPSKKAETTHYHRAHSGRIKTPGQRTVKFRLSKSRLNGDLDKGRTNKNGQPDKRFKSWRNAHPSEAKPTGFMPGSKAKRRKYRKHKSSVASLIAVQEGCVINGEGFHLTLSSKFTPTIFHAVALMISGQKGKK